MYDRRVSRGSTYAPSKRTQPLASASFRPVQPASQQQQYGRHPSRESLGSAAKQHPLPPSSAMGAGIAGQQAAATAQSTLQHDSVDFIRIATPEPVAGRVHTTVQTDTYLEDLRRGGRGANGHEFGTQTDAENDRATQPLFVPRSSGEDVATHIEPQALFDFDLEVQAVLGVLLEKSLEQALMEVLEEQELAQLATHQASFQQEKNRHLVALQELVQRDARREEERQRRAMQEIARAKAETQAAAKRSAALLSKQLVSQMQEEVLARLTAQGAFYDPVRREVETVFMPSLLADTAHRLQQHRVAADLLDEVLASAIAARKAQAAHYAIHQDQQRVHDLVKFMLAQVGGPDEKDSDKDKDKDKQQEKQKDKDKVPIARPTEGILTSANKAAKQEEDIATRATQMSATAAAAIAASAAASAATAASSAPSSTPASASASSSSSSSAYSLPPPSADDRALLIVRGILAERAAALEADKKRRRDIMLIQALMRGRRDRARAAKMAARRKLQAERAAMSPLELLASLPNYLGFKVALRPAAFASSSASASSASSASPAAEVWVVSSLDALGPGSQAGLVLGDQVVSFSSSSSSSSSGPLAPVQLQASTVSAQALNDPALLKRPELGALNPGDLLSLQVVRLTTDARAETVGVEIAAAKEDANESASSAAAAAAGGQQQQQQQQQDQQEHTQEFVRDLRAQAELPELQGAPVWLDAAAAQDTLAKMGGGKLGAVFVDLKTGGGGGGGGGGGAKVGKVSADSAAARAGGLQEGDVVVSLDGRPLPASEPSKAIAAALKDALPGHVLDIQVLAPAALEQLQAAAAANANANANDAKINLKTMQTINKKIELGSGAKKPSSIEAIRSLRRIAGLPVFGEQ